MPVWKLLDLEEDLEAEVRLLLELIEEGTYQSVAELRSIAEHIINIISEMEKMENGDR